MSGARKRQRQEPRPDAEDTLRRLHELQAASDAAWNGLMLTVPVGRPRPPQVIERAGIDLSGAVLELREEQ